MVSSDTVHHVSSVVFGLNPMVVAASVLIIAYAFIISEKINSAVISLLGAGTLILMGVLNQDLAVDGIDFNTIFLLIGMMVIVNITKRSGIFQFVAIYAAKMVKGNPRSLLVMLCIITAVFSALLDNVTTVLLIVPITLLLTEQLKIPAYPFLFALIFSSNVGGTATLIGDPPNILIGSAVGLGFMDFVVNLGPIVLLNMFVLLILFDLVWGRKFKTSMKARAHLLRYDPFQALTDIPLLCKSLFTLFLVILGFIVGHGHGIEAGTVALTGAAFLMLLDVYKLPSSKQGHQVQESLAEVEWETIFFFIGLFILVYGVDYTGLLTILAEGTLQMTGGDPVVSGMGILWSSALLSAIVNNIPFVATMIPMIEAMGHDLGGDEALTPLWWALSLGACLGGNGSIIGASANVMVASFAERAGQRISFTKFLALAFPCMILTIIISTGYLWFVFFI